MKITTSKKFLKKIILILCLLLSYFLFVDKPQAKIILPSLPSGFNEEWPYIISYDPFGYVYLTYCKSTTEQIRLRNAYSSTSTYTGVQIGYCYTSDGAYDGYAYRRGISQELTQEQINNYDFEINGEWGTEYQSNSRATNLSINPTTRKIITWKEYMTDSQGVWNTAVITGNTNIYNYNPSTEILLTPQDYEYSSNIPTISYETIQRNGYTDVYFYANDYTTTTIQNYDIKIINQTTGNYTQETIQPNDDGFSELNIKVYEPTLFYYYVEDKNTLEKIQEEYISISNVTTSNFNINITNINKETQTITYNYENVGNITNFTCFHQISGGSQIEDLNCNTNTSYNLYVGGNKSVNFKIYYNEQIQFNTTIPFIFNQSTPYINFNEEIEGNLVNLKIILNSYNTSNYITKYIINNGIETTQAQLNQEPSTYNDKYSFTLWNLTETSNIIVNIYDLNNNLISSSFYKYNSVKIEQIKKENIEGVNGFFNFLNLDNISSELKQYILNFSNVIMSSRLGALLTTMAVITMLYFIISLIRR